MAQRASILTELNYKVNKAGLNEARAALQQIQNLTTQELTFINKDMSLREAKLELVKIQQSAQELETALESAFDPKLGTTTFTNLKRQLDNTAIPLKDIMTNLQKAGPLGTQAFQQLGSAVMRSSLELKEANKFLNSMGQTFFNTIKWSVASSAIQLVTSSVQEAFQYSIDLDKSLNDIMLVTDKSAESMEKFAKQANKAAKELGKSTRDYTEASLIYYQQGLSDKDVTARTETTLKAANVTGQSTTEVSEQLTAVWNGYKVSAAEAEKYVDKLSAVAASTASDLEELSTGMSKVASAANIMGVDIDQLNASMATVISVTKQAPESVGTAFKTIYARMGDIEAGLDSETTLGKYTEEMKAIADIDVLDANGQLRDMGTVIEEIGNKWTTLSREQQVALSQAMAGTRQYNNLLALFDNWDMYTESINTSANATGFLQKQQNEYMESTKAHLQELSTAGEKVYDAFIDNESFNNLIDKLTTIVDGFGTFIEVIGGGGNALAMLGQTAMFVFREQISAGITNTISNFGVARRNAESYGNKLQELARFADLAGGKLNAETGLYEGGDAGMNFRHKAMKEFVDSGKAKRMSPKIAQEYIESLDREALIESDLQLQQQEVDAAEAYYAKNVSSADKNTLKNKKIQLLNEKEQTKIDNTVQQEMKKAAIKAGEVGQYGTQRDRNYDEKVQQFIAKNPEIEKQIRERVTQQTFNQIDDNDNRKALLDAYDLALNNDSKAFAKQMVNADGQTSEATMAALNQVYVDIEESSGSTTSQIQKIQKEIDSVINKTKELGKESSEEWEDIKKEISEAIQAIEKYKNENQDLSAVERDALEKEQMRLAALNLEDEETAKKTASIGDIGTSVGVVVDAEEARQQAAQEALEENIALEMEQKQAQKRAEQQKREEAERNQRIQNTVQGVMAVGEAFNTLGMAMSMLPQLSEIWSDEELSGGEKLTQTLMILGSLIPMVAMTFSSMGPIFDLISKKFISTGAAAGTMWAGILGPAVLVLAAIGLVVGAVILLSNSFKSAEEKAKEAAESVETLTANYNRLTEEVNKFKEAVASYDEGIKSLEDLKRGTEEYNEAVKEANENTKALIEEYELYGKAKYIDGVLTFDEGVLEELEAEKDKKANEAEDLLTIAKINQNQADIDLLKKDFRENTIGQITAFGLSGGSGITIDKEKAANLQIDYDNDGNALIDDNDLTGGILNQEELDSLIAWFKNIDNIEELSDPQLTSLLEEKLPKELSHLAFTFTEMRGPIQDYIDSLSDMENANKDFARDLMRSTIEETFGVDFREMATTEEGVVDEALYTQLVEAAAVREEERQQENENRIDKDLETYIKRSDDGTVGLYDIENTGDLRAYLSRVDKSIDAPDNDKELAELYAETVLGLEKGEYSVAAGDNEASITNFTDDSKNSYDDPAMRREIAMYYTRQAIIEKYTEQVGANKEEYKAALDALMTGSQEFADSIGTDVDIQSALLNSLSAGKGTVDLSSVLSQMSPEDIEKLGLASFDTFDKMSTAEQENVAKSFLDRQGLTETQIKALGYKSAVAYYEAWAEEIDTYDVEEWYGTLYDKATMASELTNAIQEGLNSGEITKENIAQNESYSELKSNLETLKRYIPELTAASSILNDTNLVGTQLWNEALEEAQNTLNNLELGGLAKDFNETWEEIFGEGEATINIEAWMDSEEFESQLEDLLNAERSISIEIHTQAEESFDNTIAAMNNLEEQASKIGEDFVVAAEDVRELNNAFPGILDNVTDLRNGSVKLNKEVAESAIASAQQEVTADVEASNEKIKNSIKELKAKRAIYQAMANAAYVLATEENLTEEQKADYQKQLTDGLTILKQEAANLELSNSALIADNSNDNAQILASNWGSAYQSATADAATFADAAVEAAQVAAAGKGSVDTSKYKFNVNYNGATGQSEEATQLDAYQEAYENAIANGTEGYSKLYETYQRVVEQLDAEIIDMEGMLIESSTELGGITDSLNNIASGKGASGNEKSQTDLLEDELDIYREVNKEIEKLEDSLSQLEDQQDKLVGDQVIDNLNKQLEILEKQKKVYQEKINLAYQEALAIGNSLSAQGVSINENGEITNYNEILKAKMDFLNEQIQTYNSLTEAQQKAEAENLEKAQQEYDDFKEQLSKYEETQELIKETQDIIQEAYDKEIEIQISKFITEIELKLDTSEAQKQFNEFKKEILDGIDEDDLLGNATAKLEDFSIYYNNTQSGLIQSLTSQVNEIMFQIQSIQKTGTSSIYGDNISKAYEDLKKINDELMSAITDVNTLRKEIQETYIEAIDKVSEEFDKQAEKYEKVNEVLTHNISLIKLLYGENAYAEMESYYNKIEENNNQQLDFLRKRVDTAYNMMQIETNPEAREAWEEEWLKSLDELNSKVEESLQNVIDKYGNTINRIFDDLSNKITNGKGLDYLKDEWDLMNQLSDAYLDEVNSAYGIQKIESEFLDAIDSTDSISGQSKLNKLMNDELEILKEKDKLTQYDLDRANKKLDIAIKEMALEDAKNNKSQMRLRRDSQGNYSYQFVANEDSISKAEEELAQAQNELYNFDKDAYEENLDSVYNLYVDWDEKIRELRMDTTLSDEERLAKEEMLNSYYSELINGRVAENESIRQNLQQSTFDNLIALHQIEEASFDEMTQNEIDRLMNDLVPAWDSSMQDMTKYFVGEGGFIPSVIDALNEAEAENLEFKNSLNDLQASAKINFEAIGNGYDEVSAKVQALIEDNDGLISKYAEEVTAIQGVMSQLDLLTTKYQMVETAAKNATVAAFDAWMVQTGGPDGDPTTNDLVYSFSTGETSGANTVVGNGGSSGSSGITTTKGNETANPIVPTEEKEVVKLDNQYYGRDSDGNKLPFFKASPLHTFTSGGYLDDEIMLDPLSYGESFVVKDTSQSGNYIKIKDPTNANGYIWIDKKATTKYDTGGYTGDWNSSDGKIAMLHQKELVLNAKDTENMLTAVSIVRDIDGMLQAIDSSIMNRMADLMLSFDSTIPNTSSQSNQTVSQTIYIDAEFPEVESAKEIKEAFENLANVATMRAFNTER